eukprot:4021408-Amphidinium_carterae.1
MHGFPVEGKFLKVQLKKGSDLRLQSEVTAKYSECKNTQTSGFRWNIGLESIFLLLFDYLLWGCHAVRFSCQGDEQQLAPNVPAPPGAVLLPQSSGLSVMPPPPPQAPSYGAVRPPPVPVPAPSPY